MVLKHQHLSIPWLLPHRPPSSSEVFLQYSKGRDSLQRPILTSSFVVARLKMGEVEVGLQVAEVQTLSEEVVVLGCQVEEEVERRVSH